LFLVKVAFKEYKKLNKLISDRDLFQRVFDNFKLKISDASVLTRRKILKRCNEYGKVLEEYWTWLGVF